MHETYPPNRIRQEIGRIGKARGTHLPLTLKLRGEEAPERGTHFKKTVSTRTRPRGIRINAVCRGTINTSMVADMLAKELDAMKKS